MLPRRRQSTPLDPALCHLKSYEQPFGRQWPWGNRPPTVGRLRMFLHTRLCRHRHFTLWLARPARGRTTRSTRRETPLPAMRLRDAFPHSFASRGRIGHVIRKRYCSLRRIRAKRDERTNTLQGPQPGGRRYWFVAERSRGFGKTRLSFHERIPNAHFRRASGVI